jgi:thiamine-monophosphate kinase
MESSKLTISELGEINLINKVIKTKFFEDLDLDDCAVLQFGKENLLISVDQFFENPFVLDVGGTYRDLGKLFVIQNASDIAAMGGKPIGFMASISMPANFDLHNFELLLEGMKEELAKYDIPLLGGDTKEGDKLKLCGTILGKSESGILRRVGANIGDLICVTNGVGLCLSKYIDFYNKNLNSIYSPKAKITIGRLLAKSNLCTSCMDLSDGIITSLETLSEQNDKTFKVDLGKVSCFYPQGFEFNQEWTNFAFGIGGDFELLFTMKNTQESYNLVRNNGFSIIGEVIDRKDANIISEHSSEITSWEHFSNIHNIKSCFSSFMI